MTLNSLYTAASHDSLNLTVSPLPAGALLFAPNARSREEAKTYPSERLI